MEKSTEELLEEYKITWLEAGVPLSISSEDNRSRFLVAKNERCRILKLSNDIKEYYHSEYVGNITIDEFKRLLAKKKLANITSLDMRWSGITKLHTEIGQLTKLTSLDLSSNQLTSIPTEIGQLTKLTSLNLSGNQLTGLPAQISQLANLTLLNLRINRLTSLPAEIGKLANLTKLLLSGNQLTTLPIEIGKLTYLTTLTLDENTLISLPAEIGQLASLTSLDLRFNKLTHLPVEIGQLNHLTTFTLTENNLISLPTEIGQLASLTSLDLSFNKLTNLPIEIGQLIQLTLLNLSNSKEFLRIEDSYKPRNRNEIKKLPVQIQALKALKELDLRGNPLDCPPELLYNIHDPQAILNYFAATLTEKRRPVNETKLLVVGQGTVGKTSLIQRIVYGRFDQHEDKTEGIAIQRWSVDGEPPNPQSLSPNPQAPISINIWDFGGQEIMHATHQFFLTQRSLYLLVLDARSTAEENRVEYWLKIIQSFGGESPVLLVGNKSDQHSLDIARQSLQEKYSNIVGILETSAATGAGVEELKTAIAAQVNHLAHVHDLLPESWFNVKQRLEEQRTVSNFITQEKYTEICVENSISDESMQHTLIGLLHDLGVVLHFQDDPRLQALGILNPQWVTNGIYKIINTKRLMQSGGVLTLALLNEILNLPNEYPRDKRLYLVDMMKKFELCYNLREDQTFLIPDLLPKDSPPYQFDGTPAFEYHYPVLPPSVMTRFIVRMNEQIDSDAVWRNGVLLQIGENHALVRADTEDRTIKIAIDGTKHTRRDALAAIRHQLGIIHASIKGLNPEQFVPIPGAPHVKPVEYETLLMMERDGDEVYKIRDGAQLIRANINQMLNGVESEYERKMNVRINIGGNVTNTIIIVGDDNVVNTSQKMP